MAERYINAYDFAETIKNLDITVAGKPARWNDAKYTVLKEIAEAPDADVVEVKHGEWIRQKGRPEAICSECGREVVYQTIDNRWQFEYYCPHCGAKMDGKPQKEGTKIEHKNS